MEDMTDANDNAGGSSTSKSNISQGNVGVAFGLVIAAGMATALGSSVVFFPKLVRLASRRVLASGLGFSAGVMMYVSFVEIFYKSKKAFSDGGLDELHSYTYATACFFGGVAIMVIIDIVLTCCSSDSQSDGNHHHDHHHDFLDEQEHTIIGTVHQKGISADDERLLQQRNHKKDDFEDDPSPPSVDNNTEVLAASMVIPASSRRPTKHHHHCCVCSVEDPGAQLEEWQQRAKAEEEEKDLTEEEKVETKSITSNESMINNIMDEENMVALNESNVPSVNEGGGDIQNNGDDDVKGSSKHSDVVSYKHQPLVVSTNETINNNDENEKLNRMGMTTALAIGIHNFPEGLATFVGALGDLRVGAILAIAIAVHNVPEGLCVSMPLYYATGNRWKAFGWGVLSGISEPIGALLGWLVLSASDVVTITDFTYAVVFGLVSGMMVIISIRELLPTAHRYDDTDKVVTYSFIVGMFVMASSLVLFYF